MRSLRSSSSHQLSVPRHNLSFGSRAFRFSAPRVWNLLPVSIRESHSLPTFGRKLKHFTFSQPTPLQLPTLPRISMSTRPDSSKTSARYKSCTYLLTYLLKQGVLFQAKGPGEISYTPAITGTVVYMYSGTCRAVNAVEG